MKLLLFFRCTTLDYAQKFVDYGNIRFGTPEEWIVADKEKYFGRGDALEGTCLAISKHGIEKELPNFEFVVKESENFIFYQRKEVLKLRAFCLFGLSDINFTKKSRANNKKISPSGEISNSYFHSFFPEVKMENYEELPPNQKPVVIFIKKPNLFLKRIKDSLINFGFQSDEIIINPIQYINKYTPHIINVPTPYELFFKDLNYRHQSEFRIIINSCNKKVLNNFSRHNGIINVGNLSDIAEIYDFYFDDMKMIFHDNILEFSLPKANSYTLTNPVEMMCLIHQALRDEMPGEDATWEKNKIFIDDLLKQLKEKNEITFDWNNLKFYNQKGEVIFDASDVIDIICSHVDCFLDQREYQKAIDSCKLAINLLPNSQKGHLKLEEVYSFLRQHNIKIDTFSK